MKNRSKLKIKGLNQEKIINILSETVKIYNYKKNEENLSEFEVDFKNNKKTIDILQENNVEIISNQHKGLRYRIKKLFSSVGVLCGIFLAITIYCIQYFFIWRIEVYGIENTKEIVDFIDSSLPSKLKSKINLKNTEILVKNQFSSVSSISMAIVGQSLLVNINQTIQPSEMNGDFHALVSNENCQITEINLIQGTLNCKVGDIIQKGDILVFPYVIDSQGERRDVEPKAEIFADVWLSEKTKHYDYYLKTERTGKKIVNSQIICGDKIVYEHKKEVKFDEYQIEKEEIMLTKNLLMPLWERKTIYYETTTFEVSQPFEEVKEEIIENTRLKALQFLQKNEIIKKETYVIKNEYNFSEVTYIITVNRNIGG